MVVAGPTNEHRRFLNLCLTEFLYRHSYRHRYGCHFVRDLICLFGPESRRPRRSPRDDPRQREQKMTFGEMREIGVRGVVVHCADYKCSHSVKLSAERWADDVRLSDIEGQFTCTKCGKRGAEVRPDFKRERKAPTKRTI
jgi:hypothetical protein